jgi:hypothetical protein
MIDNGPVTLVCLAVSTDNNIIKVPGSKIRDVTINNDMSAIIRAVRLTVRG